MCSGRGRGGWEDKVHGLRGVDGQNGQGKVCDTCMYMYRIVFMLSIVHGVVGVIQ